MSQQTETFQHYQVLRREDGSLWELGRGAMGVTYKAFDVNLRCPVALKVVNSAYLDHPVARQRFIREARAAAQLRHRNIASVYHLGMDERHFFYAMEFIDGETLDSLVRRTGPLPVGVALRIGIQAARALNAAARRRLLHRDIKPANLMIVDDEEEADGEGHLTVKIIDFGLARSFVHGDATQLTVSGFVGTPQFASPEQLEEKDLDARSDIYSLGVTLWFLLAGRPPFTGTLTSLVSQHISKPPPWQQLENVPEPVCKLLGRMLQKDPDRRPQNPGELRREIEACLKAVTSGEDPTAASAELQAEDLRLSEVVASNRAQRGEALGVGTIIANRYQLTRLMGEGNAGQVFQAHDILSGNRRMVAVKVFNRETIITPRDYEALSADVAAVRRARHPNLLEVFSLERCADHACVMMEWGGGVTLSDVLRSRSVITLGEALRLLKQAAIAADHAAAHELQRLELGMHQVLLVAPEDPMREADAPQIAALLANPSSSLAVKIDALGTVRDPGEMATWMGNVTLTPPRLLSRDTRSSIEGLVEGSYTYALAALFYELVSGAPPAASYPAANGAGEPQYAPLPVLREAGNAVLRRALSVNPGFANNEEFFAALARAAGFDPAELRPSVALGKDVGLDVPRAEAGRASGAVSAPVELSPRATAALPAELLAVSHTDEALPAASLRMERGATEADTRARTAVPTDALGVRTSPAGEGGAGFVPPGAKRQTQRAKVFLALLACLVLLSVGLLLGKLGNSRHAASARKPPLESIPRVVQSTSTNRPSMTPDPAAAPAEVHPEPVSAPEAAASKTDEAAEILPSLLLGSVQRPLLDAPRLGEISEVNNLGVTSDASAEGWPSETPIWLRRPPLASVWPGLADFSFDDLPSVESGQNRPGSEANGAVKSAGARKEIAKSRARTVRRRPPPAPNFWQRLFGVKPGPKRSK